LEKPVQKTSPSGSKRQRIFRTSRAFTLLDYAKEERAPKFRHALLNAADAGGAAIMTIDKQNMPLVIKALDVMTGWRNQPDMAKALTADALLLHLMPIDEALLDRPCSFHLQSDIPGRMELSGRNRIPTRCRQRRCGYFQEAIE
jgi:hypothetical protein